jgi:hypothetical protein
MVSPLVPDERALKAMVGPRLASPLGIIASSERADGRISGPAHRKTRRRKAANDSDASLTAAFRRNHVFLRLQSAGRPQDDDGRRRSRGSHAVIIRLRAAGHFVAAVVQEAAVRPHAREPKSAQPQVSPHLVNPSTGRVCAGARNEAQNQSRGATRRLDGEGRPSAFAVLRFTIISNLSGTAPGDRPASRLAECDRHKRQRDEGCLPSRLVGAADVVTKAGTDSGFG